MKKIAVYTGFMTAFYREKIDRFSGPSAAAHTGDGGPQRLHPAGGIGADIPGPTPPC